MKFTGLSHWGAKRRYSEGGGDTFEPRFREN